MDRNTTAYRLRPSHSTLIHGDSPVMIIADYKISDTYSYDLEAQVRSGDYFITLATILDLLAKESREYTTRVTLEDIVSDLIQLQDNYTINAKEKQAK